MKRWLWGLLFLPAGCGPEGPTAPPPPVDAARPARIETATFALG
jgi:hypothetical protein